VGSIKAKATTRGRVHYTLRFDNSELELVDTRGFTLPQHWRSELLRLVRGQSLPHRNGDKMNFMEVRNRLQDSIKPLRARVVLLVLRGDKAGSDDYEEYRQMGQTLDGVVPYLYVITYTRLPADLNVTRLAKKLGAKAPDMVFPIELYSSDDPAPNEERNGRLLSLLLHVIAVAETLGKLSSPIVRSSYIPGFTLTGGQCAGVGLYDAYNTRFVIAALLAVAVSIVSLIMVAVGSK
jgi:hypothetical protein